MSESGNDPIARHNRTAWDREVELGNRATQPLSAEEVARARAGIWELSLTGRKVVPREWFPPLAGASVLCLACGGGQQAPLLAAAGASVTLLDQSPRQLARDREVATAEGLAIRIEEGDMRDLRRFASATFDVVVLGLANQFVPDLRPLWSEISRVLTSSGTLIAAFMNPVAYLFDWTTYDRGEFRVTHSLPYSDLDPAVTAERRVALDERDPLEFGHTLTDQIAGQLNEGFWIVGFFEDAANEDPLGRYTSVYCVTCARRR